MIKLNIKGIKAVEKSLAKFGEEALNLVEESVFETATIVENVAKDNVPFNNGTLKNSILYTKTDSLTWNVGTSLPYAPYMEFGTGVQVSVPPEFETQAQRARTQNKGTFAEGVQNIREWLISKGGDPKLAYYVLTQILKNGLRPRPFMYPGYLAGKKFFNKNVRQQIKILEKKFNNG